MRSVFRLPDWSLGARLLALLVALAVVGRAAADFASYRALHSYLYDRVDQQLESAFRPVTMFLGNKAGEGEETVEGFAGPAPEGGGPSGPGPGGSHLPDTAYGLLRTADGEVLARTNSNFYGEETATPKIP